LTPWPDLSSHYNLHEHPDGIPFPKFIGRAFGLSAMDLHGAKPKALLESLDPDGFHFSELPIVVVRLTLKSPRDCHVSSPYGD